MLLDVLLDQPSRARPVVLAEHAALAEDLAQRRLLAEHPGVHGVEQLLARDEVHLQGEQAEHQVAVGRRAGAWDGPRRIRMGMDGCPLA